MERRANILLVDDREANLLALGAILADLGQNLVKARSGEEALKQLLQNEFAVVLLDVQMPGMDGLETAALIRQREKTRHTPIIFVTALGTSQTHISRGYAVGAVDYLSKPFVPEILKAKVQVFVDLYWKTCEVAIQQSQLEMQDRFLSHVSHELRTPLAPLYQFVTLLLDEVVGTITPPQRECLEIALRNVGQLQGMIDQLVDATSAASGSLTVRTHILRIGKVIADAQRDFKTRATDVEVELSVELPEDLPVVCADGDRVRQVLNYLIENAIKFSDRDGVVTVRAGLFAEEPGHLRIAVSDAGSGVAPEDVEKIFAPLIQGTGEVAASRKGLGLGLYLCRELVTRQGGRIWVDSKSGQGSVFSFTLPLFSLEQLLRPLIIEGDRRRASVAVITVTVRPDEARVATKLSAVVLDEIWRTLERCALPDKDLVLPRVPGERKAERFFIICSFERDGADVLVRRIQDQLSRSEALAGTPFEFEVVVKMVDAFGGKPGAALEEEMGDLARTVEELMEDGRDRMCA